MNKTPSISQLARDHKISRSTLTAWRDAGVDLSDATALAAKIASKRGGKLDEDSAAARLRKLKAEADLAEMKAKQAAGKLVSLAVVDEAFFRIGAANKVALIRLENDLPELLSGLGPAAMKKIIRAKVDEILTALSTEGDRVWD